MKTDTKMEQHHRAPKLTAAEKRFAHEMRLISSMSLQELLNLEKLRMPIGV